VVQSSSNVSSFLPVPATPVQAVTVGLMNTALVKRLMRAGTKNPGLSNAKPEEALHLIYLFCVCSLAKLD